MVNKIYPVIMCGGPGTRLWPASDSSLPKPFMNLIGGLSLFQRTVNRMAMVQGAHIPIVITSERYINTVRNQLAEINLHATIIAEPVAKDSAAAVIAATKYIVDKDSEGIVLIVASDHNIPNDVAFARTIKKSLPSAKKGSIITFGIMPTRPAIEYGYIRPDGVAKIDKIVPIKSFEEKPNISRAIELCEAGCYWNSGNFMFRADILLSQAQEYASDILISVSKAVDSPTFKYNDTLVLGDEFRLVQNMSFDVAIMEKTTKAVMLPVNYAWDDLGNWESIWNNSTHDSNKNSINGNVIAQNLSHCFIRTDGTSQIIALGLTDTIVVANNNQVLVADMNKPHNIKSAVSKLPVSQISPNNLMTWLCTKALPIWQCFGVDYEHGGFYESILSDYSAPDYDRRLRVQARQLFCFSTAQLIGCSGPYNMIVEMGYKNLQKKYQRKDGLYFTLVDRYGHVVFHDATLYDQAFVLLAMSAIAKANSELLEEIHHDARNFMKNLITVFGVGDLFKSSENIAEYLSNPIMHLFESVLAWKELTDDNFWKDLANTLAMSFMNKMYDKQNKLIAERFDENWNPISASIEPGHQFEWSWLIKRWAIATKSEEGLQIANDLYSTGNSCIDKTTRLVPDEVSTSLVITKGSSRLWPQTERAKAAVIMNDLVGIKESCNAIWSYLLDNGLWKDYPNSNFNFGAASSFYHLMVAIIELQHSRFSFNIDAGTHD